MAVTVVYIILGIYGWFRWFIITVSPPHIHFGNSCTMFLYTMPWFLDIGYTFFT